MENKEDCNIIERLSNPSTKNQAFESLVKNYSEPLYWKIRGIVLNHNDTDDILQNLWIKVWNSIESFRGDAQLSTWLYRIAINEAITFLNKEKSRQKISDDEFNEQMLSNLEADEYFDGNEATIILEKALLTLPVKQRLVFEMRYFQEIKYSEMAKLLETSEGALKASYHHAVKKIESFLNEN